MALIEIDGLPNLIAWWIFPWRTVSHNQMVTMDLASDKLTTVCEVENTIFHRYINQLF